MKKLKIAAAAAVAMTTFAGAARAEMTNLEVVFVKADQNGDSALSKAEVLQIAIEQFVIADTDGDGMLEKEEAGDLAADPEFSDNDNVIPIPVNDPSVKEIAGALFKPQGAGPFPAVVYMSGCNGLNFPPEVQQEKRVIDTMLSQGVAMLIVDPFTPRGEKDGACDKLDVQGFTRGGDDAVAALKVMKAMPDIDPNRVFLLGYSYGAISSLYATDMKTPGTHDARIAGLIAYYPYCYDNVDPSVPTLVLIGENDDWTPAANCQAVTGKANFEVVVYPGATHGFTEPFDKPFDVDGHHLAHDEAATKDAQERADAFIDAH